MLNIGGGELLIILLMALIFLGPGRLPEVARQVGQTMSSLRGLARGFQAELEAAARPDPLTANEALKEKARQVSDDPFTKSKPITPGGPDESSVADEYAEDLADEAAAQASSDVTSEEE